MTSDEICKEIAKTLQDGHYQISEQVGGFSQTSIIKIESLLMELVHSVKQDILDTVWREYIK